MCTAITCNFKGLYFGRTLDYHRRFGQEVVIAPRGFDLGFEEHLAIIGAALVADGYPLFFEGMNECGLCMAGLNFEGSASYFPPQSGKVNLAQYKFIPYILGKCRSLAEAVKALEKVNITDEAFSADVPPAPLHWIIADCSGAVTVECVRGGMNIFVNEVGVLTNNPPFEMQMANLANYMSLSPQEPLNNFCKGLGLQPSGAGFGAIGLPGDMSPQSRFVRAAFIKCNSAEPEGEEERVNQFFHILGGVSVPLGCCAAYGGFESTLYACCCSAETLRYYFTTYGCSAVSFADMRASDLRGGRLVRFAMDRGCKYERLESIL